MRIVDMHCDTVLRLMDGKDDQSLLRNNYSVDIEKLKRGNALAQFFAMFVDIKGTESPFKTCTSMLDRLEKEVLENKESIKYAGNYNDIINNDEDGKMSVITTVEEGEVLEGNLDNISKLYERGVRLITLTWNYPNHLGYPNCQKEYMEKGLTDMGKNAVEEMNRLHMIVDVSHLSDGGFYDVAKITKTPFVASHSNAREVRGHSRNLKDDMIKILAEKGGIMGINFCADFLGDPNISRVEDMISHIKHIRNVGGIDVLALGTDFDGIDCELEINNSGEMEKLYYVLNKNGFTESEIEKIFYKNALRVIKDTL